MKFAAIRLVAVAAACTALTGCAALVLSSFGDGQRAAWFLVPADKAVIYFYRDEANDDTVPLALSIDGDTVGETLPSKFLFYAVTPGHHTLTAPGAFSDSVEFDAEAGKTYFVGQEVGCDAAQLRLHLHTVDAVAGRARVRALYAAGKASAEDGMAEKIPPPDGAITAAHAVACPSAAEKSGGTRL